MKISIITATFNSAATVRDTLESVSSQTYEDIEHITIDGASKDDTLEIVKQFPHVAKVISEPDKGIYDAMNKGILAATGDVIGILNSDDVLANQNTLETIAKVFESSKNVDIVYGNLEFFKSENQEKIFRFWKSKPYYPTFFEDGNVPPHPTVYVKADVYSKVGLFNTDFKISADYDLMFRILRIHRLRSVFIDEVIVKMRMGGESTSGFKSLITSYQDVKRIWEFHNVKIPPFFIFKRYLIKLTQLIFK